jgi:mannosyltransferase
LLLLEALRTGDRRWWAGYALAVLAVVYTHYIGIFVVAVQAAWALWTHREYLRAQIVVYALIVLALLPWLPSYLLQQKHSADEARRIALYAPASLHLFETINAQALVGHPFVALDELPGTWAVALAVTVIALASLAAVVRVWRRRGANLRLSSPVALVALLAVATPVGVVALSLRPGMSFMLPRNLSPSLVPVALLVGWLLTSLGRRAALPAVAAMLVVLTIGAEQSLDSGSRRTPYRAVAHYIDNTGRPGDPVIQEFWVPTLGPLGDVLLINLGRSRPIMKTKSGAAHAWALGERGADVFVVLDLPGILRSEKTLPRVDGPANRFHLVAERKYDGLSDVLVGEYRLGKSSSN